MLDFIQRAEGLTLPEAIQRLGGGTGLAPSPAVRSRTQAAPRRTAAPVVPQRDPAALSAATRFYLRSMLRSSPRRVSIWRPGASASIPPAAWVLATRRGTGCADTLKPTGFGGERIRASGLFTERGERFAGMVVVPDLASGRVRWLVGRAIDPERSPRFQALPGPKPVLGLGRLGAAPSWVVLTEGVFDWLALVQWGLARRAQPWEPRAWSGWQVACLASPACSSPSTQTTRDARPPSGLRACLDGGPPRCACLKGSPTWRSLPRIPTGGRSSWACLPGRPAPLGSTVPLPYGLPARSCAHAAHRLAGSVPCAIKTLQHYPRRRYAQ